MFFESWKVGGSCCSKFLSICLFVFHKNKTQFKFVYTMNHVYQIYLSNWYLYYYYSLQENIWYWLIWFDGDGRNSTATVRFTPTARSPSREAVLIYSTCRQTKLPSSDSEYWTLLFEDLLQNYLLHAVNM